MRGGYTAAGKIAGVTAAPLTLLMIEAPANALVEVVGFTVTNESNSTPFQLQAAAYDFTLPTTGSPYTTLIPTSHEPDAQAAASTVFLGRSNSTGPSTLAADSRTQEGGNSVIGTAGATAENPLYVAPGAGLAFRLMAPTTLTATDLDVRVDFREIG